MPADTSSNELSYVLIVQQPDDKEGEQTDGDQDMTGITISILLISYLTFINF